MYEYILGELLHANRLRIVLARQLALCEVLHGIYEAFFTFRPFPFSCDFCGIIPSCTDRLNLNVNWQCFYFKLQACCL